MDELARRGWMPWLVPLTLLSLFAVALSLRLGYIDQFVDGNHFWVFPDDPPYHLRRALIAIRTWPAIPYHDNYVNFPVGGVVYWPPGMAWLLAGLTKLMAGPVAPNQHLLETIAAYMPPVVGALLPCLVYIIGARNFGNTAGLAAALIVVIAPGAIQYTLPTRYDHHIFEPILISAIAFAIVAGAVIGSRVLQLVWVIIGALLTAAAFYVWPGVLLHLGLLAAAVLASSLLLSQRGTRLAASGAGVFALTIPLVIPLIVAMPWASDPVFYSPSPLHLWCLAAAALTLLGASRRLWSSNASRLISVLGILLVVMVGSWLVLPIRSAIVEGLAYVAGSPFAAIATESGTMLETLRDSTIRASWPVAVSPILAIAGLATSRRLDRIDTTDNEANQHFQPAAGALFSVLCILFAIPSIAGTRWMLLWIPFGALVCAAMLIHLASKIQIRPGKKRFNWAVGLAFMMLALSLFPSARALHAGLVVPASFREIQVFMKTVRAITPPPAADEWNPQARPTYGILTPWWLGHLFVYVSGRPTLGNNFYGTPTYDAANRQTYRHYANTNCRRAAHELLEQRLRYVVTISGQIGTDDLRMLSKLSEDQPDRFVSANGEIQPYAKLTLLMRLVVHDGRAFMARLAADGEKNFVLGCGQFRLIAERRLTPRTKGHGDVKLFEVVNGAHLRGHAEPGTMVGATLNVRSAIGRQFQWTNVSWADQDGNFSLVVPYATDGTCPHLTTNGSKCRVSTEDHYLVRIGKDSRLRIAVEETDVVHGHELPIN